MCLQTIDVSKSAWMFKTNLSHEKNDGQRGLRKLVIEMVCNIPEEKTVKGITLYTEK